MAASAALAKSPNGRGRPRSRPPLTRQRVLEAALALVDREGLADLTIRQLGFELGVEGMSLYRHVADKDAVLDGIVELLWAEVPASPDPEADWRDALRALAAGLRAVLHRHPRSASLLVTRNFINAAALRCYDAYVNVLQGAGFDRRGALDALCAVTGQGLGLGLVELWGAGPDAETVQQESELQRLRRVSGSLPADLPDSLFELAMELTDYCDVDRCFSTSINTLIGGLAP